MTRGWSLDQPVSRTRKVLLFLIQPLLLLFLGLYTDGATAFQALTPRQSTRGTTGCRSWVCGLSWLDQQVGPNRRTGGGEGSGDALGTIPDLLGSKSLGLDWGHKKIGLAVSAGFSERPLGTIPNTGGISSNVTLHAPTLNRILMTARAEGACRLVIGNPLYRNGTLSPQAKTTQMFSRLLANRAVEMGLVRDRQTPFVYLWDERLTSQAAKLNIRIKITTFKSADVDSQAACLILEDFYRAKGVGAGTVLPDEGVGVSSGEEGTEEGPPGAAGPAAVASSPPASEVSSMPSRAAMSYKDWIEAERQRYASGDGESQGEAAKRGTEGDKKKKKKKRT